MPCSLPPLWTSTLPSGKRVAVWEERLALMEPVALQRPVAGS